MNPKLKAPATTITCQNDLCTQNLFIFLSEQNATPSDSVLIIKACLWSLLTTVVLAILVCALIFSF